MKKSTKKKLQTWWKKARKRILKAITAFFATLLCISCGVTKANIQNKAQGTQTTITITTNNPITTNTDANPNLNLK